MLRLQGVGIKVCIKPNAFGNALGQGIVGSIQQSQQEAKRDAYLADDQMRAGREDAATYADAWDRSKVNSVSQAPKFGELGSGTYGLGKDTGEGFMTLDPNKPLSSARATNTVGKEGARGAWGIAESLAGAGASNEKINHIKNQLLSDNPELAKGVKLGQTYTVPNTDTHENISLARAADRAYALASINNSSTAQDGISPSDIQFMDQMFNGKLTRASAMAMRVAPLGIGNYDQTDPTFHKYVLDTDLCQRSQPFCTIPLVSPVVDTLSAPRFGWGGWEKVTDGHQTLIGGDPIIHRSDYSTGKFTNQTEFGHIFHYGAVESAMYWKGDTLRLKTVGYGYATSAVTRELNYAIGYGYFGLWQAGVKMQVQATNSTWSALQQRQK